MGLVARTLERVKPENLQPIGAFKIRGAGKSGNPCARFTALCWNASRVISRITDSVNCVAFFDPVSFDMIAQVSTLKSQLALALSFET